jgi:hypothetical protein
MPPQTGHTPQKRGPLSSAFKLFQLDRFGFMMSSMRRGPFTVLLVVAMSGCAAPIIRYTLPTPPSDLTSGLIIYENPDYKDRRQKNMSAAVESDIADLWYYDGPCVYDREDLYATWDDCISSIRVAPGWRAIVYSDKDFLGESLEISADVPNLKLVKGSCHGPKKGLNDCITSIRVLAPTAAPR